MFALFSASIKCYAQIPPAATKKTDTVPTPEKKVADTAIDTLKNDSIPDLPYDFKRFQKGSLYLNNLMESEIIYDPESKQYIMAQKIGDYYIKHPSYMSQKEYKDYRLNKDIYQYFKEKVNAVSGRSKDTDAQRNLLPKYYIKSGLFKNIFGGNTIEVNPQGSVLTKMGILYQKVENPQLSERNRQSTTFDFAK
ncbi:MAG: hypothetical protein CR989_01125 [Flavobacteriales bacterium]|nr:MAG: hypothetical protein CR989_01125 [Flavobacteriales bacterium]